LLSHVGTVSRVVQRIGQMLEENAGFANEVLQNYEQLNLIFDLTQQIAHVTDIREIEQMLVERVARLLSSDSVSIVLSDGQCRVRWSDAGASNACRLVIARLPSRLRTLVADATAFLCYWPLARSARLLERWGYDVSSFPLAFYRGLSFYTMRTDALDRFGTRVEHRFTRRQIGQIMKTAGLVDVQFSDRAPYWCAIGRRA
jgi:hypothetical protein